VHLVRFGGNAACYPTDKRHQIVDNHFTKSTDNPVDRLIDQPFSVRAIVAPKKSHQFVPNLLIMLGCAIPVRIEACQKRIERLLT
jgi:hypothetical protein